eukprot:scaffold1474_cov256-Pinguiococcus_pyrenoidosus.AAC.19
MLFRAGFGRLLFLLAAYPSAVDALAFRVSSARPALGAPLALRATSEHSVDVSRNETAVAAPMPKKKGVLARLGEGGLATLTAYGLINTAFYNVGLVVVMLGAQGVAGEKRHPRMPPWKRHRSGSGQVRSGQVRSGRTWLFGWHLDPRDDPTHASASASASAFACGRNKPRPDANIEASLLARAHVGKQPADQALHCERLHRRGCGDEEAAEMPRNSVGLWAIHQGPEGGSRDCLVAGSGPGLAKNSGAERQLLRRRRVHSAQLFSNLNPWNGISLRCHLDAAALRRGAPLGVSGGELSSGAIRLEAGLEKPPAPHRGRERNSAEDTAGEPLRIPWHVVRLDLAVRSVTSCATRRRRTWRTQRKAEAADATDTTDPTDPTDPTDRDTRATQQDRVGFDCSASSLGLICGSLSAKQRHFDGETHGSLVMAGQDDAPLGHRCPSNRTRHSSRVALGGGIREDGRVKMDAHGNPARFRLPPRCVCDRLVRREHLHILPKVGRYRWVRFLGRLAPSSRDVFGFALHHRQSTVEVHKAKSRAPIVLSCLFLAKLRQRIPLLDGNRRRCRIREPPSGAVVGWPVAVRCGRRTHIPSTSRTLDMQGADAGRPSRCASAHFLLIRKVPARHPQH